MLGEKSKFIITLNLEGVNDYLDEENIKGGLARLANVPLADEAGRPYYLYFLKSIMPYQVLKPKTWLKGAIAA